MVPAQSGKITLCLSSRSTQVCCSRNAPRQFIGWGIPAGVVARVRDRVTDMWGESPSSWVSAWAAEAQAAEARRAWLNASLCWGAARFPCAATPTRQHAHNRQLECYLRAVDRIPATFLRWELEVPYRSGSTTVAVHVWRRPGVFGRSLLVLCGGVDTWKIELHRPALVAAMLTGMTIAVIDMPGTGESRIPLAPDVDEVLAAAITQTAARVGATRTALLGISFGGHWAAKLALTDRVDAAVDLGGPIGADGATVDVTGLPNGMAGIVGNALHLHSAPDSGDAARFSNEFSLRRQGLLDARLPVALLAVNGTADPYIPFADTTVFTPDPNATVWLVRDATHCAAERITRVLPAALTWAHTQLEPGSHTAAAAHRLARQALNPLLSTS
jgi:esterase FrsA